MLKTLTHVAELRLRNIELARRALLEPGSVTPSHEMAAGKSYPAWMTQSWQRCLAHGQLAHQPVSFDQIPAQALRRIEEANHTLLSAARPALAKLGRAIADTRYFAILTNAQGIVVDVNGPVDRSDPRANAIARVGVDLSERSVGTTAIGVALAELQPVWLHRGEHFFADNACYSCAGAPLFGPDGACVGMLDLTGIDVEERHELRHLVAQSARTIENALTLERPHSLLVRLNWPGRALGDETDGLVCLDSDGWVTGANQTSRQMVRSSPRPAPNRFTAVICLPCHFKCCLMPAGRDAYGQPAPMDVPLWSGLRLHAVSKRHRSAAGDFTTRRQGPTTDHPSLKDVETALIRKAVVDAKGNVMQAARELGISRATVYRKLGNKKAG